MKIICLSDTHCKFGKFKVPDGDVLVHSGDLTFRGTIEEMSRELSKMGKLPHKVKIYVPGNHDGLAEKNPTLLEQMCKDNGIIYLHDKEVIIEGIKFYGSGWTPEFFDWYLMLPRGQALKEKWDAIPEDVNVLITHGPPFGILDLVPKYIHSINSGEHVGCEELRKRIFKLPKLKLAIFGHIHDGYGTETHNGTQFLNASICNESYKPKNKPWVIEI